MKIQFIWIMFKSSNRLTIPVTFVHGGELLSAL